MRRALNRGAIAVALVFAASPAFAHGIEGLIQFVVISAAMLGLLAGVAVGATASHPGYGVLITIGLLFGGVVVYLLIVDGGSPELLGILGMMMTLVAFEGVLPLVIAFFTGFGVAAILRARFWHRQRKDEPAP